MKKSLIITIVIAMILLVALFLVGFSNQITGEISKEKDDYFYSYTKAICNGSNFCQDYEIVCEGDKIVEQNLITGAFFQNPEDWKDPRNNTNKELC